MRRRRQALKIALFSFGLVAFASAAAAADDVRREMPCPATELKPVGKTYHTADDLANGVVTMPFAMIGAFFDFAYSDDLAKLPRAKVEIAVTNADGSPAKHAVVALIHASGSRFLAQLPANGKPLTAPIGDYTINAVVGGVPAAWASKEVNIRAKGANRFVLRADQTFPADAPPAIARPTPAGSTLTLDLFDGRMSKGALVVLRNNEVVLQQPFEQWPVAIPAPPTPGSYVLRVIGCAPTVAVASWPFEVTATNVGLTAADKVKAGADFEVRWSGDGAEGDLIGLRRKAGGDIVGGEYAPAAKGEKRARFVAPFEPGAYEIVYRSRIGPTALATRALTVEPGPLAVAAPLEIAAGEFKPFVWPNGPGNESKLEVWPADATPGAKLQVLDQPGPNRVLRPPGAYELRLADGDVVRWRKPLRVTALRVFDEAPRNPAPGQSFTLHLPKLETFDHVIIAPLGAKQTVRHEIDLEAVTGGEVKLAAPALPGRYELIYEIDDSEHASFQAARVSLDVAAPDGALPTLTAPSRLGPIEEALVSWVHPDDHALEVWRVDAGKPPRRVRTLDHAGKIRLALPPGAYEWRLVAAESAKAGAPARERLPLAIVADKLVLDAPALAAPGEKLTFRLAARPAPSDQVAIVRAGSKEPLQVSTGLDAFVGFASPHEMEAPDRPGRYELIYLAAFENSFDPEVLDRTSFTVK